ncbi:MAG: GNAT family N-acetyltransferase [Chloroflexota bacterium]|nr:GNAT family N-acetyltransferase [Chloroflexota bacterium]
MRRKHEERMKAEDEELTTAASRPIQQQRLDAAVLRTTTDFASLQAEWDELYENCPRATPFQSWAWLYSWWEVYGEGRFELRLVTVREAGGLLVGLLPLMVRRGLAFGRLLLVGGDVMTPYKDVLVRDGWEENVARAGAQVLKGLGGWRVADLQELMPEAAAWDVVREWVGLKTSVPITDYVLIRAGSWEELLSSLSRNLRSSARRTLRRAEEDGVRCEPAGSEDAERAARQLVALHRELWQGRRIAPDHLTARYEAFIEATARRMTPRGIGRISEFRRDDTVVASQFLVFDKDFAGVYVIGASQEASRRYLFVALCNWDAMNVAGSQGSAYVSWMDGTSRDKRRWATEEVTSRRAILGRSRAFWGPYAGYHLLRERYFGLQLYVHSEGAPRWIKKATERYYALQSFIYTDDAPRWIKSATERYWELRQKYGYGWLQYKYELARVRREMQRSTTSRAD